jgi:hypothetical protein
MADASILTPINKLCMLFEWPLLFLLCIMTFRNGPHMLTLQKIEQMHAAIFGILIFVKIKCIQNRNLECNLYQMSKN